MILVRGLFLLYSLCGAKNVPLLVGQSLGYDLDQIFFLQWKR